MIDPTVLRNELTNIQKQLPPTLELPEDPVDNIWHFYRYLTVVPLTYDSKLVLAIHIPLVGIDSKMTLYRVHNIPIFHPKLDKSLQYNLEGSSLAITKDQKYGAIMTDSEFLTCTMADGHFCALNTGLYNLDSTNWCLIALLRKDTWKITKFCSLEVANVTGPSAVYLDEGHWAISLTKRTEMELRCTGVTSVTTLNPPLTFITLDPGCSGFSPELKLPPYFKKYSRGLFLALKSANLTIPKFNSSDFRIWDTLNLTNLTTTETTKLKTLQTAKQIPIDVLQDQISQFRHINFDEEDDDEINLYLVGGGSGVGLLLLIIVIVVCVWWYRRKSNHEKVSNTAMNKAQTVPNMSGPPPFAGTGPVRAGIPPTQYRYRAVDSMEAVEGGRHRGMSDHQAAFASLLLDHLEEMGANVNTHRRRVAALPAPADSVTEIEN